MPIGAIVIKQISYNQKMLYSKMGRSRYKVYQPAQPHFLTCTVLHWLPIFYQKRIRERGQVTTTTNNLSAKSDVSGGANTIMLTFY